MSGTGVSVWQAIVAKAATRDAKDKGDELAKTAGRLEEGVHKAARQFRLWEMPVLDDPLPDWFLEFAEASAERLLNSYGVVEKVSPSEFFKTAERARQESSAAEPELAGIVRWLIAPRTKRSVSPFFESDRETYLDRLVEHPIADVDEAAMLETGTSPVRLALIGRQYCIAGRWPLGEHYVARAREMAPNDAEVRRIFQQVVEIVDPNRTRFPIIPDAK